MLYMNDNSLCDCGGKAKGLFELFSLGLQVPEFFVIPFYQLNALKLANETSNVAVDTNFVFPEEFNKELDSFADSLGCELFAVRSSASVEDSSEKSFAGQFETVLSVTKDKIAEAVLHVWRSASFIKASECYFNGEDIDISIIVQRQLTPDIAGVCFSSSLTDSNKVLIEYADGICEKLVSGEIRPTKIEVRRDEQLKNKCFDEMKNISIRLAERLGYPLDFEFAIQDDKLWLIQMRPLTIKSFEHYDLPEGDYSLYVRRNFPWYIHSVQVKASMPEIQLKNFGFALPIYEGALIFGEEYYSNRNDELTYEALSSMNLNELSLYYKKVIALLSKVKRTTKKIQRIRSPLSNFELCKLVSLFEEIYLQSYVPMMMRPDSYLEEKIRKLAPDADILSLSFVDKYTDYRGELTVFEEISKSVSQGKSADSKIKHYLKKYSYLIPDEERTPEATIIRAKATGAKKTIDVIDYKKKKKHEMSKLNGETKQIARLFSNFVYLRTRVAECSDKLYFYGKNKLFPLIAQNCGVNCDDLVHFGHGELSQLITNNSLPTGLSLRRHGHFVVWCNGKAKVGFGMPPQSLVSRLKKSPEEHGDVIHGEVASPGRVVGKVKKVQNANDAKALSEGLIMVATMTIPEYTVAFSKAAGFITDEGGSSCHASIIARELSVPCIVGTKIATELLSDGDTVLLDAYEGIVKIIKKQDIDNNDAFT